MADGAFPGLISKDRNVNSTSNPIFVQLTDGTDVALINASGFLEVNVNGTVTVSATDLDIRDLTHVSDSVKVGDGTDFLAVNADGSINAVVSATNLDIRDLTHVSDSVKVGDGTDFMAVNSDGSINVNLVTAAVVGEVHNYNTAASVASDATSNHDYTVTGTTFILKSIIFACSGGMKVEIQTGPVASLVTKAVGFLTGRQGDTQQLDFNPPIEVPVTSTGTVRVIRTNRSGSATDVYSTIIGQET